MKKDNCPIEISSPAEQYRVLRKLKQENKADLELRPTTLLDGPAAGSSFLIPRGVNTMTVTVEDTNYLYVRSAREEDAFRHLKHTVRGRANESGVQ